MLFELKIEDSYYQELTDGSYEVGIDVSAKKYEADGEGQETQVPLDALIDIAILGEERGDSKMPEVIYMEKQQMTTEQRSFVFQVSARPVSVGIDPFNKLVDRNPQDNVKNVELRD